MKTWRAALPALALALPFAAALLHPVATPDLAAAAGAARPDVTPHPTAPPRLPDGMTVVVVPSIVESVAVRHVASAKTEALRPSVKAARPPRPDRDEWSTPARREPAAPRTRGSSPAPGAPRVPKGGLLSKFESLDFFDASATPPDPIGAAGPDHVVNVINVNYAFHRQSDGVIEETGFLSDFFAPLAPTTSTFDPKIVFDPYEDRFVVVTLERRSSPLVSRILVAVSDDGDPNGTWYQTSIRALVPIGGEDRGVDYPGLGVDEDAVYVTANMFGVTSGVFADALIWIVAKGAGTGGLYDGGAAGVTLIDPPDGGNTDLNFTLQPADLFAPHPAPDVGTFFTAYNGANNGFDEFLHVYTLMNPLTAPTLVEEFVNIGNLEDFTSGVLRAPQPVVVPRGIAAGDSRAYDSAGRGAQFAVSMHIAPLPGDPDAGQWTAHWVVLDGTTPGATLLVDQGNVSGEDIAPGTYTYYPAVTWNDASTLGIGFSASGPGAYVGSYYTFRKTADPPGTVRPSRLVQRGLDYYINTTNGGSNRWGDYSGIAPDPVDDCFWVFNQFADLRNPAANANDDGVWSTIWGEFCPGTSECGNGSLEPGETCDPPGPGCNANCSFCGDGTVNVGETCDPPGGACRTDCTSCGDRLVDPGLEDRDDGNAAVGDGCDASCRFETCGNGVVQVGETCDPPGAPGGLPGDCRSTCTACGDGQVDPDPVELLTNGDFEFGNLFGWSVDAFGAGLHALSTPGATTPITARGTAANPAGGAFYAVSGGGGPGTHALSRSFTVPAGATQVLLDFEMFVNAWNGAGAIVAPIGLDHTGPANQHARVDLLVVGAAPFTTGAAVVRNFYLGVDPGGNPHAYTSYGFDVTADVVPGGTYVLRFADTGNQFITNQGVDNVSLRATLASPEVCDDGNNVDGDGCTAACEAGCGTGTNVFSQPITALDKDTFGWSLPVDTRFVRGSLALVDVYDVIATGSIAATSTFNPVPDPAPGDGFYLLFRVECPVATWSSGGPGECPLGVCDRDASLP